MCWFGKCKANRLTSVPSSPTCPIFGEALQWKYQSTPLLIPNWSISMVADSTYDPKASEFESGMRLKNQSSVINEVMKLWQISVLLGYIVLSLWYYPPHVLKNLNRAVQCGDLWASVLSHLFGHGVYEPNVKILFCPDAWNTQTHIKTDEFTHSPCYQWLPDDTFIPPTYIHA